MNYETNQVVRDAKMILKIEDGVHEDVLTFLAEDCINAILAYCRLEFLPYQLIGIASRMTADIYRTEFADGGKDIVSIAEGDRKFDFNVPEKGIEAYADRLRPFMNIRGILPSEKNGGS